MKKLFGLLFITVVSLNATVCWTRTGLHKVNVYVKNDISLVQPKTITSIKKNRADKSATFALTYFTNNFIKVDKEELEIEVLESVYFLLSQFSEDFTDDQDELNSQKGIMCLQIISRNFYEYF